MKVIMGNVSRRTGVNPARRMPANSGSSARCGFTVNSVWLVWCGVAGRAIAQVSAEHCGRGMENGEFERLTSVSTSGRTGFMTGPARYGSTKCHPWRYHIRIPPKTWLRKSAGELITGDEPEASTEWLYSRNRPVLSLGRKPSSQSRRIPRSGSTAEARIVAWPFDKQEHHRRGSSHDFVTDYGRIFGWQAPYFPSLALPRPACINSICHAKSVSN